MADGFYWYVDPDVIGQKFSVAAKEMNGILGGVVSEALDEAAQDMRERIAGLPRIRTGDMYNSIDARMTSRGERVSGNFGYIDGAPFYTVFQEYGTSRGITPARAFVDASLKLQATLRAKIDAADIWRGFR